MRIEVFVVFTIIFLASIPNNFAQELSPPCIDESNYQTTKYYWAILSYFLIPDWQLRDIHLDCRGLPYLIFEIPKYSSENSKYMVELWRYSYLWDDYNADRHEMVEKSITRLHSTEIFKAIDTKFENKKILFVFTWENDDWYRITAYDDSEENDSYFEFTIDENDLILGDDDGTGFNENGELVESVRWGGEVERTSVLTASEFFVVFVSVVSILAILVWQLKKRIKLRWLFEKKDISRWEKPEIYLTIVGLCFLGFFPIFSLVSLVISLQAEQQWIFLWLGSFLLLASGILIISKRKKIRILSLASMIYFSIMIAMFYVIFDHSTTGFYNGISNSSNHFPILILSFLFVINGLMYGLFINWWKQSKFKINSNTKVRD